MTKSRLPALLVALLVAATPSFAQDSAASYSDDQKRFLSVAQSLEAAPLDPQLRTDRAWAMQWLIDAPDVSVTACLDPLGGMSIQNFDRGPDIIAQYILSMAAFIIKHPELKDEIAAQQVAGVESALTAYQAMRSVKASAKSPPLEKLLDSQRRGELSGAVRKAYLKCANPKTSPSTTSASTTTAAWEEIWDQPGVAIFYADRSSITRAHGVSSLATSAQYREPLPEGYISERIRVEEFDCKQHRSRLRQSIIFGNDGRAPKTVQLTAEESQWTAIEAGSLGQKKESLACAARSD